MIDSSKLYKAFLDQEVTFFSGVPDSLLKNFCGYIFTNSEPHQHVVAANEGGAVALASGFHLATGKVGLVYLQNSGLGNAINPLVSLADKSVYSIPIILFIGWRGAPGKKDEPQHIAQGEITLSLLDTLSISYEILPEDEEEAITLVERVCSEAKKDNSPKAIVVRDGLFKDNEEKVVVKNEYSLTREEALKIIISTLDDDAVVVSSTGKLSRELFELRENLGDGHKYDFLTVGSMGHASQIALGIAIQKPKRKVYCLDGDGAAIMHLGSLAIIGKENPNNFHHIIFNNGVHESVGGQPTAGFSINFEGIANSCNYKHTMCVATEEDLLKAMETVNNSKDLTFLEVRVNVGSRNDLTRPTTTPEQNKETFMEELK